MKKILIILAVMLFATTAFAGKNDIDAANIETSEELVSMTKEIGYAISIPATTPADPLGLVLGVDIGVEASVCKLDEIDNIFREDSDADDKLYLTRLHVQKGLPYSIDLGVELTKAVGSNIQAVGGEVRWAVFEDGMMTPAVGLRAMYSTLLGVDNIDITTYGLGIQTSKEILFITPFVGADYIVSTGKVTSADADVEELASESEANPSIYAGLKVSLLLINLTIQTDVLDNNMTTLKLGVSF